MRPIEQISSDNNMGLVRYYLAFSVLIAHFNTIFGTQFFWPTSSYNAVGGFFALSGFLVYSSYLKTKDARQYILRRAKRIMPAYWFIVLLCAFGLCIVSNLSPAEYFSTPQWWKYLISNLTFLNFIEPSLPGVFTGNPETAVNGSLWTMKVEWCLYLSVPIAAWLVGKFKGKYTMVFAGIVILSLLYRFLFVHLFLSTGKEIYNILGRQFIGQLMFFYVGVFIRFKLKEFIRFKWLILALCVVLLGLTDILPFGGIYIPPFAVSSLVIWFSMIGKWGTWAGSNDNISYDIYLFHFPVIQLLYYLKSNLWIGELGSLLLSLTLTVVLASVSWFLIGKPVLRNGNRKKRI